MRTLLVALPLLGCLGIIGDPDSRESTEPDPLDPRDPVAACVDGDLPAADLLRIDRDTYLATLRQAFSERSLDAISTTLESVPETRSETGQYASEQAVPSLAVVTAYLDVASALAFEVTATPDSLTELDPCLAEPRSSDPYADVCLDELVRRVGRVLMRRPLLDDEVRGFLDAYRVGAEHSEPEGVATLLMEMLVSPRFLYYVEVDAEPTDGVARLSGHEIAARLARVVWNAPPDPELADAADRGLDETELANQVERMLDDPRARLGVGRFFRDWLELDGDAPALEQELLAFVETLTLERDATYAEILTSRTAFIDSDEAAIGYGLDPATRGEVQLDELQRAGILTRAAWLSTLEVPHTNAGHIIRRGDKLGRFICDPPPRPDDNLFPPDDPAEIGAGDRGIRARFQDATTEPQCAGCHARLDGFGAPFGHYAFDGSWLETERLERDDGDVELEIDASSTLQLDTSDISVSDAIELSSALATSDEARGCMSQHLVQNIVGRGLHTTDSCFVRRALDVLSESGSIRAALVALLTSTEMTHRSYSED